MKLSSEKHSNDKFYIYSLAYAALCYAKPVGDSLRFDLINYKPELKPVIYAIWHGAMYGILGIKNKQERKNINILISPSNDGEIINIISETLGYSTIRGSHKRNGAKAYRNILNYFEEGKSLLYTVDGPKGPNHKVKEGIIRIAQTAQVPIVPIGTYGKWVYKAKSWDKCNIPIHFSKSVSAFGEPIQIPSEISDEEKETFRMNLENEILNLHQKAKEHYK